MTNPYHYSSAGKNRVILTRGLILPQGIGNVPCLLREHICGIATSDLQPVNIAVKLKRTRISNIRFECYVGMY